MWFCCFGFQSDRAAARGLTVNQFILAVQDFNASQDGAIRLLLDNAARLIWSAEVFVKEAREV